MKGNFKAKVNSIFGFLMKMNKIALHKITLTRNNVTKAAFFLFCFSLNYKYESRRERRDKQTETQSFRITETETEI